MKIGPITPLNILLTALLIQGAIRLRILLSPFQSLIYNDKSCQLKGEMHGSEDMVIVKDSILLFTSTGDLSVCLDRGSQAAEPGGIWALDVLNSTAEPRPVHIHNYPHTLPMHGHGLYVSNLTDRVYVVNHLGPASVIEVLHLDLDPVSLTHIKTINSDLFPRYGINDVVEGVDENEIYVTRWQAYPIPENGLWRPGNLREVMDTMLGIIYYLLGIPATLVYRCLIDQNLCEKASHEIFTGANGITISADRSTLFIADPPQKRIAVMRRQTSGFLQLENLVDIPLGADNLHIQSSGEILMGTMPDYVSLLIKQFFYKDAVVPGGLSVLRRGEAEEDWRTEDILLHDGNLLSQVSMGARFEDRVFLGSPHSQGILVCQV